MTALVDKLIKMDYVKRTNDINDRRRIYLAATKNGEVITSKINKSIDNQIDDHLFRLTQEEIEALKDGLLVLQKLCPGCNNKKQDNGEDQNTI
jgi:DNA-binding MarR family transcriptional regulator